MVPNEPLEIDSFAATAPNAEDGAAVGAALPKADVVAAEPNAPLAGFAGAAAADPPNTLAPGAAPKGLLLVAVVAAAPFVVLLAPKGLAVAAGAIGTEAVEAAAPNGVDPAAAAGADEDENEELSFAASVVEAAASDGFGVAPKPNAGAAAFGSADAPKPNAEAEGALLSTFAESVVFSPPKPNEGFEEAAALSSTRSPAFAGGAEAALPKPKLGFDAVGAPNGASAAGLVLAESNDTTRGLSDFSPPPPKPPNVDDAVVVVEVEALLPNGVAAGGGGGVSVLDFGGAADPKEEAAGSGGAAAMVEELVAGRDSIEASRPSFLSTCERIARTS